MSVLPAYMCMRTIHTVEAREGCAFPDIGSQMVVTTKWVLGTKSGYDAREGSAEPSVPLRFLKVSSVD